MSRELPIAQLRHLYANLMNGGVRDTASAKRIATGLLGPVIEAMELERFEVLHRMKYHPNIDGEGDWELFPIDTDECKECFEVLIVRAKGGADSPPP